MFDEVCRNPKFETEAEAIRKSTFIQLKEAENGHTVRLLRDAGLDLGESEAIALADTIPGSLLLVDERKGRQIALSMGIQITGTLGILLQAKRLGFIGEIKPFLDALISSNIRIGADLYDAILRQVGEL